MDIDDIFEAIESKQKVKEQGEIFSCITDQNKRPDVADIPMVYMQNIPDPIHASLVNEFRINTIVKNTQVDQGLLPSGVQAGLNELKSKRKMQLMYILLELTPMFQRGLEPENYFVILIDQFYNLPFYQGDHVKVFGQFEDFTITIQRYQDSGQNNYILFDPSVLISPTTLNSVSYCERQQVLKSIFKPIEVVSQTETSQPMVLGVLGHEIFEHYLRHDHGLIVRDKELIAGLTSDGELPPYLSELLYKHYKKQFLNAYLLKMTFKQYIEAILPICTKSILWIIAHIIEKALIPVPGQRDRSLRIKEVIDIEKQFESYQHGFCGILDCLLSCEVIETGQKPIEMLLPLELKTGRKVVQSYRMQSMIYAMLVQQAYQHCRVDYSLLLYVAEGLCQVVETNMLDWQAIVFQRNFIAQSLRQARSDPLLQRLPAMISNYRQCNVCFMNDICSAIQLINNPDIEDVSEEFKCFYETKGKLRNESMKYVQDQLTILYEEEAVQVLRMNKENQLFRSDNAKVLLKWMETTSTSGISFNVVSVQQTYSSVLKMKNTLNENDKVTLISDQLRLSLECTVISTSIKERGDSPIVLDETSNSLSSLQLPESAFYELKLELQITSKTSSDDLQTIEQLKIKRGSFSPIDWIMRKRDFNPFLQYRSSVVALVTNDQFSRLKDILISGVQPKFTSSNEFNMQQLTATNMLATFTGLNKDQVGAIQKCIEAEDFALILGYPGTGKTYVIAYLLNILAHCKHRVLIVTYTHSALDNLIQVYMKHFIDSFVLRIGSDRAKVHRECWPVHFDASEFDDIQLLETYLESKRLFFTTCLSSNDRLLKSMRFDYCIVDEASQIIEPLCLSNVLMATKFILIGDHLQLQPLVKNQRIREQLSKSMLERLSLQFPTATSKLTLQYRMNEEIMSISNILVYEGQLQLGDQNQKNRSLELMFPNFRQSPILKRIYDHRTSVVFLNYAIPTKGKHKNHQPTEVLNLEADIVYTIAKPMLDAGLKVAELAIITTYNKSARSLQARMKSLHSFMNILTIDRSQGIDKECVIVVCSSMNLDNQLMNNWRRINVAFTRAKSKLIIIGNLDYLRTLSNFKAFCALLQNYRIDLDEHFYSLAPRQ